MQICSGGTGNTNGTNIPCKDSRLLAGIQTSRSTSHCTDIWEVYLPFEMGLGHKIPTK